MNQSPNTHREISDQGRDALKKMLQMLEDSKGGSKTEKRAAIDLAHHEIQKNPELQALDVANLVRSSVSIIVNIENESRLDQILEETRSKIEDVLQAPAIGSMMTEMLSTVEDFDPENDPASLAFRNLIRGKSEKELEGLVAFLQNPTSKLESAIQKYAAMGEDALRSEIDKQQAEIDGINDDAESQKGAIDTLKVTLSSNRNQGSTQTLIAELNTKQKEYSSTLRKKRDAERKKANLGAALKSKDHTLRYNSTQHFLEMAMFHFNQSSSEIDVENMTEKAINEARETINPQENDRFAFLKPTLKGTLATIGKEDEMLARIGEEKLTKLADMHDDKTKVRVWLENLEKDEGHNMEYHMKETVPRLIAYLQLSLRDGRGSDINALSVKRAEGLLDKLKLLRRDHAMKKAKEKVTGDTTRAGRMKLYLDELSELQRAEGEINQKIVQTWGRHSAQKLGKGAMHGAGKVAKYGGIATWMTMRGLWKTGKWIHGLKSSTKKNIALTGVRAGAAGGLAWGAGTLGTMAGVGLGMGPLALAAIPGVFAPEIAKLMWRNKGKIGLGLAGAAGLAALTGWRGAKVAAGGPLLLSSRYRNWAFS